MCGIVLAFNTQITEKAFEFALSQLHHRGPDETKVHHDAHHDLWMGHTRLSITGLNNGSQPFFNADKTLAVVVNGEIYEYETLKIELESNGHIFQTDSDAEVILHLYESEGVKSFERLRGEFAIAIYNQLTQEVTLVRDRFGIKPLFYASNKEQLIVASEQKAIFATGLIRPDVDPEALIRYLSFDIPATIFKGIKGVPPGSFQVFKSGEIQTSAYWHPPFDLPKAKGTQKDLSVELKTRVENAVKVRLRSDVPLGVFLSGGVDSSIIAATVKKFAKKPPKAFVLSFADDSYFDEVKTARKTAQFLDLDLHEVKVTQTLILKHLENALTHFELPLINFSGVAKYLLAEKARKEFTVVLTGEGGDEVFLGYDFFRESSADHFLKYAGENQETSERPKKSKKAREILDQLGFIPLGLMKSTLTRSAQKVYRLALSKALRKELGDFSILKSLAHTLNKSPFKSKSQLIKQQAYCLSSFMPNYNLTVLGDRCEMAHSLEGRPPFLDHHLFEFANTLPETMKMNATHDKIILRDAFKDQLIPEVYEGKKWPFVAPPCLVQKGESSEMDALITRYLSQKSLKEWDLFNPVFMGGLLKINPWLKGEQKVVADLLLAFAMSTHIVVSSMDGLYKRAPKG